MYWKFPFINYLSFHTQTVIYCPIHPSIYLSIYQPILLSNFYWHWCLPIYLFIQLSIVSICADMILIIKYDNNKSFSPLGTWRLKLKNYHANDLHIFGLFVNLRVLYWSTLLRASFALLSINHLKQRAISDFFKVTTSQLDNRQSIFYFMCIMCH